jgi:peptidoglycan/LPS O-acetylase OafA/YrhL
VAQPTINQAGEPRLARLESLRALAALGVLESHVWGWHNSYGPRTLDSFAGRILISGDFGVNLFFTLTGYLLFAPFARALSSGGRVDLRRYALNRALRILPLYYVTLVVFMVLNERGGTWGQWWRFLTFSENFSTGTFLTVNGPMWSLVVELHFYLLLPILTWLLARTIGARPWLVVTTLMAMGSGAVILSASPSFPHESIPWARSLPMNFHFFAAGMILAVLQPALAARRWPGLAKRSDIWFAAAAAIFVVGADHQNIVFITAVATGLTVAAASLPLRSGFCTRLLDTRVLATIGVASYSLYLWHYPIVLSLSKHIDRYVLLLAVASVVCCLIALISYRLVEAPFLRLRRRWSPGQRLPSSEADRTDDRTGNRTAPAPT